MQGDLNNIIDNAISNLTRVAEVDSIVGKPIVMYDGTTVLPISQLSFAYLAGGGEYGDNKQKEDTDNQFAGGSGGGATITPIAFLILDKSGTRIVPVDQQNNLDKIIDIAKGLFGEKD